MLFLFKLFAAKGKIRNKESFKVLKGTKPKLLEFKKFQERVLGFFFGEGLVCLTNGFSKKSNKTPPEQIVRAHKIREEHIAVAEATKKQEGHSVNQSEKKKTTMKQQKKKRR